MHIMLHKYANFTRNNLLKPQCICMNQVRLFPESSSELLSTLMCFLSYDFVPKFLLGIYFIISVGVQRSSVPPSTGNLWPSILITSCSEALVHALRNFGLADTHHMRVFTATFKWSLPSHIMSSPPSSHTTHVLFSSSTDNP